MVKLMFKYKKMKKIIYIIAFAAITLLSSCQIVDVLDKRPPYDADLDGAITNAKTAELALNGVYSYLPQGTYSGWNNQVASSFRSGIMSKPVWHNKGNMVFYYERYWPVLSGNSDTEWDDAYNIIKNANFLFEALKGINDFSGNRKNEVLGELYFLKGFAYHRLLQRYGEYWDLDSEFGIIIRDDLPSISGDKKPRATVKASYEVILENLNKAIELAPKYGDSGYASILAAKATKAKVFMDMGSYAECAELAGEVIAETSLEPNYGTVFSKATTSTEVIFARKFGNNDIQTMAGRKNAIETGKWGATESYINLLEGDPRKEFTIGDPQFIQKATEDKTIMNVNDEIVYEIKKGDDLTGVPMIKLLNETNDLPIIFLRASEMYLLKGEAIMRNGGSIADAWAPIALLRARAGAPAKNLTTKAELEEAICDEWLIELGGENNTDWLSIRRTIDITFDYDTTDAEPAKT